jgi:hypothetical protein
LHNPEVGGVSPQRKTVPLPYSCEAGLVEMGWTQPREASDVDPWRKDRQVGGQRQKPQTNPSPQPPEGSAQSKKFRKPKR